jgi:two-component system OmpR family response regulator/two-component system response regulator RstA
MKEDLQKSRILLVEDDSSLAALLSEYLQRHGFLVETLDRGSTAVQTVLSGKPDLVILDLMLPDADGLDICRELRTVWRGPVLMLTAMKEDIDVVAGLEVGADDYVGKPVAPRVLLARVRALLRRGGSDAEAERIRRGDLSIDVPSRRASLRGAELDLTTTEFDLLVFLARRAGRVQDRTRMVEELRGIDFQSFDRSVDVIVSRLRRKLADAGSDPRLIRTVRGVGYVLSLLEEEEA